MDYTTIVLHLDQYFNDYRKYSKLYINDKFKNINDLQEYIKHVFKINSTFCLLDVSGMPHLLLPRSEDIRILSEVTHVLVQQVSPDFEINLDIPVPVCNENLKATRISHNPKPSIKRSSYECISQIDLPIKNAKKTPEKINIISDVIIKSKEDVIINNEHSNELEICEQEPLENNIAENINTSNNTNDLTVHLNGKANLSSIMETSEIRYSSDVKTDMNCDEETSVNDSSLISCDNITTRSRKRVRKRKRVSEVTKPVQSISVPKEVNLLQRAVESLCPENRQLSHIRFDEDEADLDSSLNLSHKSDLNSSVCESTRVLDITNKAKIVKGHSKDVSMTIKNENLEETSDNVWENMLKHFNPNVYPDLLILPAQNDIIAFRMLKMTDSYEPALSKYMVGMISEIYERSPICDSELVIQIMAGSENCTQPKGKFDLPDDSNENNSDNLIINLKWINALDPKKIA